MAADESKALRTALDVTEGTPTARRGTSAHGQGSPIYEGQPQQSPTGTLGGGGGGFTGQLGQSPLQTSMQPATTHVQQDVNSAHSTQEATITSPFRNGSSSSRASQLVSGGLGSPTGTGSFTLCGPSMSGSGNERGSSGEDAALVSTHGNSTTDGRNMRVQGVHAHQQQQVPGGQSALSGQGQARAQQDAFQGFQGVMATGPGVIPSLPPIHTSLPQTHGSGTGPGSPSHSGQLQSHALGHSHTHGHAPSNGQGQSMLHARSFPAARMHGFTPAAHSLLQPLPSAPLPEEHEQPQLSATGMAGVSSGRQSPQPMGMPSGMDSLGGRGHALHPGVLNDLRTLDELEGGSLLAPLLAEMEREQALQERLAEAEAEAELADHVAGRGGAGAAANSRLPSHPGMGHRGEDAYGEDGAAWAPDVADGSAGGGDGGSVVGSEGDVEGCSHQPLADDDAYQMRELIAAKPRDVLQVCVCDVCIKSAKYMHERRSS